MQSMYYIGLDVHKKMISYCVKDRSGQIHRLNDSTFFTHWDEIRIARIAA